MVPPTYTPRTSVNVNTSICWNADSPVVVSPTRRPKLPRNPKLPPASAKNAGIPTIDSGLSTIQAKRVFKTERERGNMASNIVI